jgi:hypothetical protein
MNEAGPATRSGIAHPVENEHEQKTGRFPPLREGSVRDRSNVALILISQFSIVLVVVLVLDPKPPLV